MIAETPQSDNFKKTLCELWRELILILKNKNFKRNVKKIILIIYVHLLVGLF